jgi:alcohol dehydrogenase class IV
VRAGLGSKGEDDESLAQKFVDGVRALNAEVGVPTALDALREADIPDLASGACAEAHLGYPVPRYMDQATCEALIRRLLPSAPTATAAHQESTPRKATAPRRRRASP